MVAIIKFTGKAVLVLIITLSVLTALLLAIMQSRFSESLPFIGGYRPLVVYSGSMEPTMHVGGIVFVGPVNTNEIQPGDIITFQSPPDPNHPESIQQRLTTHRVTRIMDEDGQRLFETKGDANDDVDSGRVTETQVVGKAGMSVPYVGYASSYLRSGIGLSVLIGLAVCLALFEAGRAIIRLLRYGSDYA